MIQQYEITLPHYPRGYHLITHHIAEAIKEMPKTGLVNVFIKHTSAGLTINENADSDVRVDFESIFLIITFCCAITVSTKPHRHRYHYASY